MTDEEKISAITVILEKARTKVALTKEEQYLIAAEMKNRKPYANPELNELVGKLTQVRSVISFLANVKIDESQLPKGKGLKMEGHNMPFNPDHYRIYDKER